MSTEDSGNVSRNCACGCGELLPPDEAGRRGRKRLFLQPACQAIFREAKLGGWTGTSDLTPRAFALARRAGIKDRGKKEPVVFVNPNACACGCGEPARWARAFCERKAAKAGTS